MHLECLARGGDRDSQGRVRHRRLCGGLDGASRAAAPAVRRAHRAVRALTAALANRARNPQADLTSQPSLNALCASMAVDPRDPGVDYLTLEPLDAYWGSVRAMYTPFETGMLSGSAQMYDRAIPGVQAIPSLQANRS